MTPEQLKTSLLRYAVQGKLVEQKSEEDNAEDLYQQIQEQRKKYKIKELKVDEIDEQPFDIPDTWKWVHLQDIVKKTIKRGKSPKYTEKSQIQVFAQKCNVKTGGINMSLALYLDAASIEKYPEEEYLCNGDIIINSTGGGTMGRVGVFHDTDRIDKMAIVPDGHVTVIRACDEIDYKYLYYFVKHNQSYLEKQGEGSTNQTELKPTAIASLLLPLPPLEEQHRIVAKIEEILPYVDRYAEAYEKLEQFNAKFPEDMKKSILQYAIQGKLVEQRPEEGTAEELYQQIQDEKQRLIKEGKIKKKKPLAEITDDEIPFDIPDSWKWVKLGDCTSYAQTKEKISPSEITPDMWSLDLEDIQKETGIILVKTMASQRKITGDKVKFHKNQVLYSKLRPYLKKILVAPDDGICTPELVPFDTYLIDEEYLVNVLKSPHIDHVINTVTYGVKMPRVGTDTMTNLLIPLPPLEEQRRIVCKINELLPYCDQLIK